MLLVSIQLDIWYPAEYPVHPLGKIPFSYLIGVGEDVCLILCEPTLVEVVGLLNSLASLRSKDVPNDLVTLAFNILRDSPSASPHAIWHVDTKLPIKVDRHPGCDPLLKDTLTDASTSILFHGSSEAVSLESDSTGISSGLSKADSSQNGGNNINSGLVCGYLKRKLVEAPGHNKANIKAGGPHKIKANAGGQRKVKSRSHGQHNLNANPCHPQEAKASSDCLQMVKEEVKENCDDPDEDTPPLPSSSYAKIEVSRKVNKNVCYCFSSF